MQFTDPQAKIQLLDNRYRFIQSLATGGIGHIYLAEDTKIPSNRLCVVKKLKYHSPEILKKSRELLDREAATLEKLQENSQIPRILAYFEDNGEAYLVQEYIEGATLAQKLEEQDFLESEVVHILLQLLKIINCVHSKGVIHRDIKPTNIIWRKKDNKLVLIDFGAVKEISHLGNQDTVIGTRGYAPNEQWQGKATICSDIYAIGMIGITALTGIDPSLDSYQGGHDIDETGEIIWQNRTKIKVRKQLITILTKMVRQKELERYQSAKEVQQDLQNITKDSYNSTLVLYPPVPLWQKLKLPLLFGICRLMLIIIAISLTQINTESFVSRQKLSFENKVINANLSSNSKIDPIKNTYYAVYLLSGRKDKQITIEINSSEFDPVLIILKPNGQLVAINDDIAPDNLNSRIVFTLPEDGKYQVMVQASQAGEMGNYQLKVRPNSGT